MKISVQRAIDRWAGQALCALISLWQALRNRLRWSKPQAAPAYSATAPRILIILLSEMGSVVLAQALFAELTQRFPGADLHVLQLKKNQSVMQLLGFVPEDNLHSLDDSSAVKLLRDLFTVTRHLRHLHFDGVIDCELFSRISALLSYASSARVKVGFTAHTQEGLYRGSFINHPVPYNTYQHISLQFVGLARVLTKALIDGVTPAIGVGQANTNGANPQPATALPHSSRRPLNRLILPKLQTQLPELDIDHAELRDFQRRLQNDFAVLKNSAPNALAARVVLLYVSGGALPIRAWPEANYTQLALDLLARGYTVGLIGLPEDTPQAQRVLAAAQSHACLDLTGYTRNLRELLYLFHSADLLITNDGGPGHFASLTPISSIVFFGPETARLYGPLSERATVLESGMACSPCLTAYNHRDSFCDGDNQCLKVIGTSTVLNLALSKLNLLPAKSSSAL
jgi:ADP-heptose:LPS heptosyltransferase